MARYIYQQNNWTHFTWNDKSISPLLGEVRNLQGRLIGKMSAFGFSLQKEAVLNTLTVEALKTSEIEGEKLNRAQVRSSIARRLGIEISDWVYSDRNVEGVVEMMLDANQNYTHPLSEERLFAWHSALFPTGFSGMHKIEVGQYRTGEMQIVSGAIGKDKVHYQAPAPQTLKEEMDKFIAWFNNAVKIDPVIKAAIAHLWFVTIHPFDDGNGRITRALSDMLIARGDDTSMRFYSMSSQILKERKKYYAALEKSQHGESDITHWINWFLACLKRALISTEIILQSVVHKTDFWGKYAQTPLNTRQKLMLNTLLDGFQGKLKSSKWAKMTKCSADTALRDIKDLIEKGILKQEKSGGRSTNYELADD